MLQIFAITVNYSGHRKCCLYQVDSAALTHFPPPRFSFLNMKYKQYTYIDVSL